MKISILSASLSAIALAVSPADARAQDAARPAGIVVQVDGLKTNDGFVFCDLFNAQAGFPNKPARALARTRVRPRSMKATCAFPQATASRYAVAVFHDVDGDLKLDANLLGIPREPVGASNNAKGSLGPPKFRDAAFDYRPPGMTISITVN